MGVWKDSIDGRYARRVSRLQSPSLPLHSAADIINTNNFARHSNHCVDAREKSRSAGNDQDLHKIHCARRSWSGIARVGARSQSIQLARTARDGHLEVVHVATGSGQGGLSLGLRALRGQVDRG